MITNTEIRNALTGALAIMALGLFASCSDSIVAPADDENAIQAPSAAPAQLSPQSCTLVDGVWVCSGTTTTTTTTTTSGGFDGQFCELIGGVLHCEPIDAG
jgi:hypothetical protein